MNPLKIVLLATINSIHTIRWANALAKRGHDIHLVTQHRKFAEISSLVTIHLLPFTGNVGYFLNLPFLKNILKKLKPDLLHAHYASGYGTLGRLSSFHPYILSVWGSDVYDFPYQSKVNMWLLKKNLEAADCIASTSNVMAYHTRKLSQKLRPIIVTPFGIDTKIFKPKFSPTKEDNITIGTVKTLSSKYGIDILLKGFAKVYKKFKHNNMKIPELRLLIVGDGKDGNRLKKLSKALGIANVTNFVGAVPHSNVPQYLNKLDIYVATSRLDSESFGVAILEASACGLPVIVSNAGGLPEVVENGVTGIVIPKENYHALANALEELIFNKELRDKMGKAGRKRVEQHYSWKESVVIMEQLYVNLLHKRKEGLKCKL